MGDADLHTAADAYIVALDAWRAAMSGDWHDPDLPDRCSAAQGHMDAMERALRAALSAATKPLTVADIPADVKALVDDAAGRQHSDDGAVMATFGPPPSAPTRDDFEPCLVCPACLNGVRSQCERIPPELWP